MNEAYFTAKESKVFFFLREFKTKSKNYLSKSCSLSQTYFSCKIFRVLNSLTYAFRIQVNKT